VHLVSRGGARLAITFSHAAMKDTTLRRMRERLVAATFALSLGHRGAPPAECDNVRPPAKSTLVAHYYATGVQIYGWSDTAWTFVAPAALLTSDAGGKRKVGTHYAGPTWRSSSGGKVAGTLAQRCTPDAAAIPSLLLTAAWRPSLRGVSLERRPVGELAEVLERHARAPVRKPPRGQARDNT
jgi:hypothetical protein